MTLPGSEKATPDLVIDDDGISPPRLIGRHPTKADKRMTIGELYPDPYSKTWGERIHEAVNGWDALKEENRRLSARVKELEAIIHDKSEGGF